MRISRADPDDPSGKRRRHFEISIDSPFTVLNCRATQANTALPRYCGSDGPIPEHRQHMSCGCPDAQPLDQNSSGAAGPLAMVEEDLLSLSGRRLRLDSPAAWGLPSMPQAAHLQPATRPSTLQSASSSRGRPAPSPSPFARDRPIHLLRQPSHNPPAFDADEPPPPLLTPLLTPPPNYDLIIGTPSVDGLADYFARLAAYEGVDMAAGPAGPAAGPSHDNDDSPLDGSAAAATVSDSDSDTHTIGPDVDPDADLDTDTGGAPSTQPTSLSAAGQLGSADVDPFSRVQPLQPALRADDNDDVESSSSASDSADDDHAAARPHRRGRVNVANPRTPGGRLVPSRSFELMERPAVRLDMASALGRRHQA